MPKPQTHSDLIFALDKQQHFDNPDAVRCPRDKTHGAMLPAIDGVRLYCGCGEVAPAVLQS